MPKPWGVDSNIIEQFGAVSEETVGQMAIGARRLANSDWGLATSGIAGPGGGTDDKPVGTVCLGLAGPDGVLTERKRFTHGPRKMNKVAFAAAAFDFLRRRLLGVTLPDDTHLAAAPRNP